MKVFCPNCGSENEGSPGGRTTCRACTANFEVPGGQPFGQDAQAPVAPPAPQVGYQQPPVQSALPPISPMAYGGGGGFAGAPMQGATTNALAIAALVSSLLCCSPVSLITGFLALQQIKAANGAQKGRELAIAGLVIGGLGLCMSFVWILAAIGNASN